MSAKSTSTVQELDLLPSFSDLGNLIPGENKVFNAIMMLFLIVYGSIALVRLQKMSALMTDNKPLPADKLQTAQTLIMLMRIVAVVLIGAPLLLMLVNVTGMSSVLLPFANLFKTQVLVLGAVALMFALFFFYDMTFKNTAGYESDSTMWMLSIGGLLFSIVFFAVKYFADKRAKRSSLQIFWKAMTSELNLPAIPGAADLGQMTASIVKAPVYAARSVFSGARDFVRGLRGPSAPEPFNPFTSPESR